MSRESILLRYRYHKYAIERTKTCYGWTDCTQHTAQGKYFELILTVKMKTRHLVGGPFNREFSAFVVIAEL